MDPESSPDRTASDPAEEAEAKPQHRRPRSVRFHDHEWQQLLERARACGLQRGRYVRESALGSVPRGLGDQQQLHQLARIGNNLNQLAKRANEGQVLPHAEILECLREVHAAAKRIP